MALDEVAAGSPGRVVALMAASSSAIAAPLCAEIAAARSYRARAKAANTIRAYRTTGISSRPGARHARSNTYRPAPK